MAREYLDWIIKRGGGLITVGEHLGVFVSTPENITQCPAGWTFVDVTTTTLDQLAEAVEHTEKGRSAWPEAEAKPVVAHMSRSNTKRIKV